MSTLTKIALGMMGQLRPKPAVGDSTPTIALPAPVRQGGLPLMEALAAPPLASRDFARTELPPTVLSNLLWAAYGANRPEAGARRRQPGRTGDRHLRRAARGRLPVRPRRAPWGSTRPATAAHDRVSGLRRRGAARSRVRRRPHADGDVPATQREVYAYAAAGAITQNVYLYAAGAASRR